VTTLPRPLRRTILLAHIACAGTWLGMDVVLGLFVFAAVDSAADPTSAVSVAAAASFGAWPLAVVAVLTLLTGAGLALATPYGLLRHWWIVTKLAINVVLAVLIVVLLVPILDAAGEAARSAVADGRPVPVGVLVYPPVVSSGALLVAMALAVFKPWGPTRRTTPVRR
jgi:hypothetical protein